MREGRNCTQRPVAGYLTGLFLFCVLLLGSACGEDPRERAIAGLEDQVSNLQEHVSQLEMENHTLRNQSVSAINRLGGRTTMMLAISCGVIISILLVHTLNSSRRARKYEYLLEQRHQNVLPTVATLGRPASLREQTGSEVRITGAHRDMLPNRVEENNAR